MKGLRWYLLFLSHYGLHTLFHLRNTIIHADSNITSMSGTEIFIPDHLIFCQLQRVYVTNANCLLHPSPVLPVLSTVRHQVKDFITTPVQQLPREEPLAATRKHPTGIRVCWLHMENNPGWGITVIAPKKKKFNKRPSLLGSVSSCHQHTTASWTNQSIPPFLSFPDFKGNVLSCLGNLSPPSAGCFEAIIRTTKPQSYCNDKGK